MINLNFDKPCNTVKALFLEQNKDSKNEDAIKQAVIICILENVPVRLKLLTREEWACFNPDEIVCFIENKK